MIHKDMISRCIEYALLCVFGILSVQAQVTSTTLIQSTDEDERIDVSIDRSVYFAGDTVLLVLQRNDTTATAGIITPILAIQETAFTTIGRFRYSAVIPKGRFWF